MHVVKIHNTVKLVAYLVVCNHGFVFALMNISKGESLAYSLGMIVELRKTLPASR